MLLQWVVSLSLSFISSQLYQVMFHIAAAESIGKIDKLLSDPSFTATSTCHLSHQINRSMTLKGSTLLRGTLRVSHIYFLSCVYVKAEGPRGWTCEQRHNVSRIFL